MIPTRSAAGELRPPAPPGPPRRPRSRAYGELDGHNLENAVELRAALEALMAQQTDAALARDPLRFPRRYLEDPLSDARRLDVEVAGVIAAQMAFGRVDLFGPVVERVLDTADRFGGPAAFAADFDAERAAALGPVAYRWFRTPDFHALLALCGAVVRDGGFARLFTGGDASAALAAGITALRARAPGGSAAFRTWLAHPQDGSACKRWWMLLRWMVRREHPDLGLWTHLDPATLLVPLDTHVGRVARFLGLSTRASDDGRTAAEISAALRELCPDDPVRYDFALAHLGISRACRGRRDPEVCPACPLERLCRA